MLDDAAERQLDAIVALLREVLDSAALGAYLHGSTALGRLQPHSDLDVLVVTERPTTRPERQRLIKRLLRMSGRGDPSGRARSIELTIVVDGEIRPWRHPAAMDFQYGDWWRAELEAGDEPWTSPNPDLAIVLAMARAADTPLFGPPARSVFEPVPARDLVLAMTAGIPGLLEDLVGDETNVVLTFARIWTTLETGAIEPKDVAAEWALARVPAEHRAVLERARAAYLGRADDAWADLDDRVSAAVEHLVAQIERYQPAEA